MKRSGTADLPLHGGRVPAWLATRMTTLGTAIAEAVVVHYGRSELLTRLSDPFWFQAFGSVLGMDWHSSGHYDVGDGRAEARPEPASRRSLASISAAAAAGTRGGRRTSYARCADRLGLNGSALVQTSRLTARVDNNAIADGFQIYLHTFVVTADGEWAVVQQGLNEARRTARRYHWHSASVRDFTTSPHSGIVGEHQGMIQNLVDRDAMAAQDAMLALTRENPDRTAAGDETPGPPASS